MTSEYSVWHRDGHGARKRVVRIETIGKTFLFYENQIRSEPYFFGDLVYRGAQGGSHVFGLDDGIKPHPHWELGITGAIPEQLSKLLPKAKKPMFSNIGMLLIAFLCLGITYMGAT